MLMFIFKTAVALTTVAFPLYCRSLCSDHLLLKKLRKWLNGEDESRKMDKWGREISFIVPLDLSTSVAEVQI